MFGGFRFGSCWISHALSRGPFGQRYNSTFSKLCAGFPDHGRSPVHLTFLFTVL